MTENWGRGWSQGKPSIVKHSKRAVAEKRHFLHGDGPVIPGLKNDLRRYGMLVYRTIGMPPMPLELRLG